MVFVNFCEESGFEVKFAALEEDGDSVVFKVSKASGICFDALDDTVEAFCGGIGNAVFQIGDDVLKMLVNHSCHALNGFEFAAARPPIPLFEELPRTGGIPVVPEVVEGFLDSVGAPLSVPVTVVR